MDLAWSLFSGLLLILMVAGARAIVRFYLGMMVSSVADGVDSGVPFVPEEYDRNKKESLDWDLQQALRKATRLAQRGQNTQALAVLQAVRKQVLDHSVRDVLDREIARLGGLPMRDADPTPNSTPGAPYPAEKAERANAKANPDDPYAERMN
jgi:hypothetical protein